MPDPITVPLPASALICEGNLTLNREDAGAVAGRLLSALSAGRGGRPKSAQRCACGKYTLARLQWVKGHVCPVEGK